MLKRGIHVGGRSPINNLGAHMSGDPRFESDGTGNWTLGAVMLEVPDQMEQFEDYDEDDEDVPW